MTAVLHSTRNIQTLLGGRPKQKALGKATLTDVSVQDQSSMVFGVHSSLGLLIECFQNGPNSRLD